MPRKTSPPAPAKKKPGPKPKAKAAVAEAPRAVRRTPRKKSERLGASLLPGVTPEIEVPAPKPPAPKKEGNGAKTFKHIAVSQETIESFHFEVSIDPAMFQRAKKSSGKVPLPVSFDPRLFNAITRYNPRKGGVSSFCNTAVARWLRDSLDQVLLASLEATTHAQGSSRNSVISIDPDMATKLKAAVTLLKSKGFAKASIQGLILGCALVHARDLRLV